MLRKITFLIPVLFFHVSYSLLAQANNCQVIPAFIYSIKGLNPDGSALSTLQHGKTGLVLTQVYNTENKSKHIIYQDSTWDDFGQLGPFVIDSKGNTYLAPMPKINTLKSGEDLLNTILIVQATKGKLLKFLELPVKQRKRNPRNPYGITGLSYDCGEDCIFISSVYHSTPEAQAGRVYKLSLKDSTISVLLDSVDAYGIVKSEIKGTKRLFFGNTRTSDVFSIEENGTIHPGKPVFEFSIQNLGPRGDDRVRRIKELPNGNLEVYGYQFYYNLIAPSEKPETIYLFRYDKVHKEWKLLSFR